MRTFIDAGDRSACIARLAIVEDDEDERLTVAEEAERLGIVFDDYEQMVTKRIGGYLLTQHFLSDAHIVSFPHPSIYSLLLAALQH